VANTLKAWLDNHYYEKEDLHALELIEEFAKTTVATGSEMISRQLQQLVERKRRGDGDALSRRVLTSGNQPPPLPLLPRSQQGRPLHVLDIQPLELARQFTIMESNCFQRIKPSECMHKAWTRPDAADIAPNVTRIIVTTNRIAVWIGLQVLRTKDVKMRAQIIKQFMHTAAAARELNNYSTMAGIVAALSASHLSRLKKTWELLSDKTMAEWADIQLSMDSTKNFGKYKEMLKTINPPCVPFLGFYLSALVFIEDGNKDMVTPQQQPDGITSVPMTPTASQPSMPRRPSVATSTNSMTMSRMSTAWSNGTASTLINGDNSSQPPPTPGQTLINFNKRHMTADILRDIQQYQSQPYNLAMCNPIYQWVEQGLEKAADETQDLYEVSLTVEPKDVGNSNRI
jgi:son of sevenless-like protein